MSFSYMYPIRYRVLEKKVAESRMRKKNALDRFITKRRIVWLLVKSAATYKVKTNPFGASTPK